MAHFWTADWHFDHKNIMKYSNRPFKNIREMNQVILSNVLKKVGKDDVLHVIGDLSMKKKQFAYYALKTMRHAGIVLELIKGNHDNHWDTSTLYEYFHRISNMKDMKVDGQKITMCHFPMISWNCSHFGAWMLHGHHHNSIIQDKFKGKIMNVSIDTNNFTPVSVNEIREFMEHRSDNWDYISKETRINEEGRTRKFDAVKEKLYEVKWQHD